ncbi:MAG: hypothetical protein N4A35_03005 [Flavobacteriales bacterium]|jgi:hypothetical protein|nr:hypothetical protein [Flavobacteriales bacterium]
MKPNDAFDYLTPNKWITLSPLYKIRLLEEVRRNLQTYKKELAHEENRLKNGLMGEQLYFSPESYLATMAPVDYLINALINLYKTLLKDFMPQPFLVSKLDDFNCRVRIRPLNFKDRILTATQAFYLHVKGQPQQINPLDKSPGVIAIISSGSTSANLEILKAIFLENKAVIHKPHRLNEGIERIWKKVFKPINQAKVLSYCDVDEEEQLIQLNDLHQIYFHGSENTATTIKKHSNITVVAQTGGNNPVIIVPGIKPWSLEEIQHQTNEIATVAKLNGGATCGRPQTIITCKKWKQRHLFLMELKKAITNTTPAAGTYYPSSLDSRQEFLAHINQTEVLHPEFGKYKYSDFIFTQTNSDEVDYSHQHEAFFQFLNETTLNTAPNPEEFLEEAVMYCNENLHGDLGCMFIIDDATKLRFEHVLNRSIEKIKYRNIAVNSILPLLLLNPYFSTSNHRTEAALDQNFSNIYGISQVEKSILVDQFMSIHHLLRTNKNAFFKLALNVSNYVFKPSWRGLSKIISTSLYNRWLKPDF